ncbi:hypothetical protein [Novispirillum itersonii]|uniref:hypothetical protein n=1 Tax=Novispirillum itersonii TaxID=189 RepID=UPI000364A589|nr:hypothetical protein [Novispirillum itersonii]
MFFDACDADKIATWKGEIESYIRTLDTLEEEIRDYFRTNGEHDPAAVIARWNDIQTINQGDALWAAFADDGVTVARARAEEAGMTLHHGTPPDGYGNANWYGMSLWYVQES